MWIEPRCEGTICPVSNQRYIDSGCLPEYKEDACCPTSFRCRKFSFLFFCSYKISMHKLNLNDFKFSRRKIIRWGDGLMGQCNYRGVTYNVGDLITQTTQDSPCKIRCKCVASAAQYMKYPQFIQFLYFFKLYFCCFHKSVKVERATIRKTCPSKYFLSTWQKRLCCC